ncbi:hypothetical protein V1478_014161 [Vespula squamosa]|uniref:Transmembrane protein n=1 Tax=Vespula squamosa TaxID=30214 RepID=A0ABD2A9M0_VESSQ
MNDRKMDISLKCKLVWGRMGHEGIVGVISGMLPKFLCLMRSAKANTIILVEVGFVIAVVKGFHSFNKHMLNYGYRPSSYSNHRSYRNTTTINYLKSTRI